MERNRMTWAAGRLASAAPATPGYGKEDQDHPAHQPDPDHTKYQKGDPEAWAEGVRQPPYKQGNPPSTPGYDVEDKDHPAHIDPPRVPKEAARRMQAAVELKARKCCIIARAMLGKKASSSAVEDQGLDMMNLPDTNIQATLDRMGGGFLAQFEDEFGPMDDLGIDDGFSGPDMMDDGDLDMMLAQAKRADQNDPAGKTLAPTPKSEEAARKEAKKGEDEEEVEEEEVDEEDTAERKTARKFFASMDTDRDGFVTKADWKGSHDLFASLDTDNDGILASAEVVDALAPKPVVDALTAALDPKEAAILNSLTASFMAKSAKSKKSEDDDGEDEEVASKKAKSKKSEDDEDEPKEAKKKAKKSEDKEEVAEDKKVGKGKKKAADDDEGEELEESDEGEEGKQACDMAEDAGMFGATGDPMGLGDGGDELTSEDDAMLAEIFGKSAADGEDDEGDKEDKGDEPEASKKAKKAEDDEDKDDEDKDDEGDEPEETEEEVAAAKKATRLASTRTASQRPQPRKPSNGVRTVGGLTRTASGNAEINELSSMWESAPDVSKVFG